MKILFAIKSLDIPGGGAERVLSVVASELAVRGHDVSVVTFDAPGGNSFYPLESRVRRIGLGIGSVDRKSGARHVLPRVLALRRIVRGERPDIAVGFMHSMFVPLAFAVKGLGIPFVASEHIVPEYYRGRGPEYTLFKLGCLMANRVTVLSESVRALYPRTLHKRMVPVPNPVNIPQKEFAAEADSVILSVGRIVAQKDHATLIRAFATIADKHPAWRVRIVGDGELRGDLEKLVAECRIKDRVTIVGPTRQIDPEYARAGVLAIPSRFESFGLVTAEGLAAGLPVVGFADCPGTNELITHGENGWLVDVSGSQDRIAAFADGLSTLLSDDALRRKLSAAGPASVRRFERDVVVTAWEQLLQEVTE